MASILSNSAAAATLAAGTPVYSDEDVDGMKPSLSFKEKVLGSLRRSIGSKSGASGAFTRSPQPARSAPNVPFAQIPSGSLEKDPPLYSPLSLDGDDRDLEPALASIVDANAALADTTPPERDELSGLRTNEDGGSEDEVPYQISTDLVDVKQRRRDIQGGGVQETQATIQEQKLRMKRMRSATKLKKKRVVRSKVEKYERRDDSRY